MDVVDIIVRYQETDQMGVVYHSNYLVWFEIGRTRYLNRLGLTYKKIEDLGVYWVMYDAHIHYHKPVKYGENVKLHTELKRYNGLRFLFYYEVRVENELRISGETELVNIMQDSFRPCHFKKIDEDIHQLILQSIEK